MPASTANILIVEDERLVAADIEHQLIQLGYRVCGVVNSAVNAYQHAAMVRPDLALMDIHIKGPVNGIEAAKRLRLEFQIPVVFLTAHADAATLQEAAEAESFGYIIKPFNTRALAATVETALHRVRVETKIAQTERRLSMTLHSMGDGVIATDRASRVNFINPMAEILTGWPAAEAIGKSLEEVLNMHSPNNPHALIELLEQVHSKGTAANINRELLLTRRDGSIIPVENHIAPVREDAKRMVGVVVTFRKRSDQVAELVANC